MIHRGADNSLAFPISYYPICSITKRFYLGWFFLLVGWDFWYCGHYWPIYLPQMIGDGDCGEIGGIKIDRGNRSTGRKHAPAPLCPPQIPHD
jgi:hypothetical protein